MSEKTIKVTFSSSTSQPQSALKGGKMVGLGVLISIGLLVFLGRSALADSQSPPISSPVTSQLKTGSTSPTAIAQNRSLPSSTVLIADDTIRGGSLKVSNGTDRDAYVKLVDPQSRTLVGALYVKSNSTLTLEQIPDGTYRVLFVLGQNWDSKTQTFAKNERFAKFDKPLQFTTTSLENEIRYRAFQITLNPIVGGNARTSGVSKQEFSRY